MFKYDSEAAATMDRLYEKGGWDWNKLTPFWEFGISLKMKSQNSKTEAPTEALIEAIRSLHGCKAMWIESVPIKETFQGEVVWEGTVQVFSLFGHPTVSCCYAWSHVTNEKTGKRKFFAVLHQGPVDSPLNAVRSAVVADPR
ncbi:MAG: hypothetical protein ACLQPD_03840 [Desulfomonilaceae bacterium]